MVLMIAIVASIAIMLGILKWRALLKEREEMRREYEREKMGSDFLCGSGSNFDENKMEAKM